MTEEYTQAVVSKLRSGADVKTVLEGLRVVLRERHHEKLLPSILRGVLRILNAEPYAGQAKIYVAAEADANTEAVKEALAVLNAPKTPVVITDDTLIGGQLVRYNARQLDQSYRSKLVELYRNITQ